MITGHTQSFTAGSTSNNLNEDNPDLETFMT